MSGLSDPYVTVELLPKWVFLACAETYPVSYVSGLSDPYVTVELLPKWVFPSCAETATAVHKATLNPVFNETIEL